MGWRKGPMPKNTYGWGGVVPVDFAQTGGFFFADFFGDHVKVIGLNGQERTLKPEEVEWYDNSITLPPNLIGRRLQ